MAVSILFGIINGRMAEMTNAVLGGADEGVSLVIALLGSMCLWSGLMKIAEKSGITSILSKAFYPIIRIIFKGIDAKSDTAKAICMNMTANLLGLGNAATPFGLKAMKELQKENPVKDTASNNMIMFVVLNTASIQLLPTTVAVLRAKHGSQMPFDILPAIWITSVCALVVGVSVCKILSYKNKKIRR